MYDLFWMAFTLVVCWAVVVGFHWFVGFASQFKLDGFIDVLARAKETGRKHGALLSGRREITPEIEIEMRRLDEEVSGL